MSYGWDSNMQFTDLNNDGLDDTVYKELDLDIELNILACIMEAYTKVTANNFLGRITRAVEEIDQSTKNKLTQNREMRRNYNKNNRRNKYRRY